MAGYVPVFDSVFHGTLCGRWPTLPVWLTILPLADRHGVIDLTYQAIHALTGWPEDLLRQAIDELSQPDPESRSATEDGRRLVLIDPASRTWGWRVVNHEKYRERARKASYDAARTASGRDRERKAEARANDHDASRDVPTRPEVSRGGPLSNSDTNRNTDPAKTYPAPIGAEIGEPALLDFKIAYPQRAGGQPWRRAVKAISARLAEGHTWDELIDGALRYEAYCRATDKLGTEFVMQAATFCGPEKHFAQPWSLPVKQDGTNRPTWRPSADEDHVPE